MDGVIVTISGLPGSGTSTAARLLSVKTGMKLENSGDVFRKLASEHGVSLEEFGDLAEGDPSHDRELDARMLSLAEPGTILEGRLTGHLLHREEIPSFKVWIEAPLEVRIGRIAGREGVGEGELRDKVIKREKSEYKRYREYYDIDLGDSSIYDMVISSERNSPEEIVEKIMEAANLEVR